ncbi:hypothetical protein CTAYLR_006952 [Chrysophaeum taylorii]|uniref:DNA mismatch repair protein n=1 Tax=Chrysophaeum taylorii TaxID=2483200 RepID=A0AAD7UEJ3_9STRA|nr:hypothetical protein CTAYLR_006952 [Chrysophaeum taylorii]
MSKNQMKMTSFFASKKAGGVITKKAPGAEMIGKRIKVYWAGDKAWYEGEVRAYEKGRHEVAYDDGDVEVVDLGAEKYQVLTTTEDPEPAAKKARLEVEKTPAPRKRRIVGDETDSRRKSFDSSAFRTRYKMTPTCKMTPTSRDAPAAVVSSGSSRSSPVEMDASQLEASGDAKVGVFPAGAHLHDVDPAYAFLTSERRDAKGRRKGETGFDPKTLQIPPKFLNETKSEVQKQWWQIKATHADCVLFFKIGRFYELYHDDADVGVKEAGLVYMKGEQAHSGFPEPAYGKYAEMLLARGYKVARVEQTETPERQKERVSRAAKRGRKLDKAEKSLRREICSLTTPGTRLYTYLDDVEATVTNDGPLLAVVRDGTRYGACSLDAPTGSFSVAEFDDDRQRTRLRTLVGEKMPVELVLPAMDAELEDLVSRAARRARPGQPVLVDSLGPDDSWDVETTLNALSEIMPRASKTTGNHHRTARWPPVLREAVDGGANLAIRALGAVAWCLRRALVDVELLSMGNFDAYVPPGCEEEEEESPAAELSSDEADLVRGVLALAREDAARRADGDGRDDDHQTLAAAAAASSRRLTLDATTLKHLEVLQSAAADGKTGSLWTLINHTKTAGGARRLKGWLARPLVVASDIRARAAAVSELVDRGDDAEDVRSRLAKIPDLERLLQQLHTLGSARRAPLPPDQDDDDDDDDDHNLETRHPDSRAVLFDAVKLNGKKVQQLCQALDGLRRCEAAIDVARDRFDGGDEGGVLRRCVRAFPSISEHLEQFETGFDLERAKREGVLEARRGADDAYDAAKDDEAASREALDKWLASKKTELRCPGATYVQTARDRYAVKLPADVVSRSTFKLPKGWVQKSKSQKFVSFSVPQVLDLVADLERAEKRAQAAKVDQLRSLFAAFDSRRSRWDLAVKCVATLDALLSLAHVSRRDGFCKPQILDDDSAPPVLRVTNGAHPCLETSSHITQVVGNDLSLGGSDDPAVLLLSGPNMGGKSTLLRHVCVSTILAQAGCFVRADEFVLTPVDRVFTRLGASDRILDGQSTFMVELLETATILDRATSRSLCILDELGRGTATFDGAAIAHSVVNHLATNLPGCRALFATHYHDLVKSWADHPNVQLGHMDCIVESDTKVAFLYKLVPGISPRSFGINVARMARLPAAVLDLAKQKSAEFEAACNPTPHQL